MFRNINELRKKYEIINSRKKLLNNSSIKKYNINISSCNDIRIINEFKLASFEKNMEKWDKTKKEKGKKVFYKTKKTRKIIYKLKLKIMIMLLKIKLKRWKTK